MEQKEPLRVTIGELRALVAEAWEENAERVGLMFGPTQVEAWVKTAMGGTHTLFKVPRCEINDDTPDEAVVVRAVADKHTLDMDLRAEALRDAERHLATAQGRHDRTAARVRELSAWLTGGSAGGV